MFDFHSSHKKPYETIIIGKYHGTTCKQNKVNHNNHQNCQDKGTFHEIPVRYSVKEDYSVIDLHQSDVEDSGSDVFNHKDESHNERSRSKGFHCNRSYIPDNKVIISVPCSLHSKKPPLTGMLYSYH